MINRMLCAALAAALLAAGCGLFQRDGVVTGSGRIASESRPVAGVEAVALQGSGEVVINQGAAESLTVEADDNILPRVVTTVEGGTLRLAFDRADWETAIRPSQPVRFVLTVRDVHTLELAGLGSFQAASLQTNNLTLRLTGNGSMNIGSLRAGTLNTTLAGSGNITAAGGVGDQVLLIAGNGTFEGGDLESRRAEVEVTGSGNATLWVRDSLSVRITGAGSVSYFGLPELTRREILGAGDINPMGDR